MPGFDPVVELSSLDGTNGFQLSGESATDFSGNSVASAGDVNGDGFDDLIVGAPGALKLQGQQNSAAGASYVVFGQAEGFAAEIELSELDGTNGFQISGETVGGFSGHTVASAGDINGDGFDDLVISAPRAAPNGSQSGATYVVFGQAEGFAAEIHLSDLDGTNGFQINGEAAGDSSGQSVASAGDVNGDGFDDVIVGARGASPNGEGSGASYVVFGQAEGFAAEIELSELDGTNGFQISGEAASDGAGISVASAGDWNGDGLDDLIVGAAFAGSFSGSSYVVFGQTGGFAAEIELSALDGTNGFKITGELVGDESGHSVASVGDLNGDNYSDLIIAAPFADPAGDKSGACYVVFGHAGFASDIELSDLTGSNGFQINGEATRDQLGLSTATVASAGDVNGDGFDDLIIGASGADPNGDQSGASYVVFGQAEGFTAEIELSDLDGTDGFQISGEAAGDASGFFVASAGDLNGDGFDDLTVGTPYADPSGDKSGASYVIFGEATASVTRVGTGENDRLFGGDFADSLAGDDGDDLLDGRGGADTMTGGNGNDTYVVDNAADTTVEATGGGTDTVQSAVTYTLATNVENLVLTGTTAINGTGNAGSNALTGNSAANVLSGLGQNDTLTGFGGNDTVNGGTGADTMTGGNGNDTYVVDNAADTTVEATGGGTDTVQSAVTYTLATNVENLVLTGTTAINGTGNAGSNALTGNSAANVLSGLGQNDTLTGFGGNDTVNGGTGADTMTGGNGNDTYVVDNAADTTVEATGGGTDTVQSAVTYTLATNVENLVLTGTTAINGTGNAGSNALTGNSAVNRLDGNAGNDTLTSFGGADVFVYDDGDGADTVTDFANGSDKFDLTAVAGVDDIGDLTITDNGSAVTVDYGTGSFHITNLADPAALDPSDFLF